jgi:hypothetical protein
MTKPQLHRHLTTGIFNQLSKILKKLRLSDFFLDRAAGNPAGPRTLRARSQLSAWRSAFCATKPDYQTSAGDVKLPSSIFQLRHFCLAVSSVELLDDFSVHRQTVNHNHHPNTLSGWLRQPGSSLQAAPQ